VESGDASQETPKADGQEQKAEAKKRGRRKLPAHLPRIKRSHDLAPSAQRCECGCQLHAFDEVVSEQLGIIPAKLYVIQHCRKKYRCVRCQSGVKTAPLPAQPIPKSNASPELLAHSIVGKFLDGLPFYRQEKIWERLEIPLPRATLANWAIKTGDDLVKPLIALLIEHQLSGPLIHIDETTVQVLKEPDKPPDGKKQFWVTVGGAEGKWVYRFHYNPSRGTEVAKTLLKGFKGTVMSDDWHVYERACEALSLEHIACNDHARRKFKEAQMVAPKKAGQSAKPSRADMALMVYKKLYSSGTAY
jgi:transposase